MADLIAPGTVPEPRVLARLVLDAIATDDHDAALALGSVLIVWFWCLRAGWSLVRLARPRTEAVGAVASPLAASSPAR